MAFPFDVFISYAHTAQDEATAMRLRQSLWAAEYKVWIDRTQIRPATDFDAAILKGLRESRHVVPVVTQSWLDREWTHREVDEFVRLRGSGRSVVPLLYVPLAAAAPLLRKPALQNLDAVRVTELGLDDDAVLWRVHCAIDPTKKMGVPTAWSELGRALRRSQGFAVEPAAAQPRWPSEGRRAIQIDRATQWQTLERVISLNRHEAIFVPGAMHEGHDFFLSRVQFCLAAGDRYRVREVRWLPVPPSSRDLFRDALARSLGGSDPVAALRREMSGATLVLVHRPIFHASFDRGALYAYYATWLPELIAEATKDCPQPGTVKAIQALEWTPPTLAGQIAALAAPGDADQHAAILSLLDDLSRCGSPMTYTPLRELAPITRDDVADWIHEVPAELAPPQLLDLVMAGASTSEQIFIGAQSRLGEKG